MESLPVMISACFIAIVILLLGFLYKASRQSLPLMVIAVAWLAVQGVISKTGFYTVTSPMPPRFLFLVAPPLIIIVLLLLLPRGRKWTDQWNLTTLTSLHIVRIPVELILYLLFLYKQVPELMTFAGHNYDILSGLTAPVMAWLAYSRAKSFRRLLLAWNIICMGLLINIVTHAVLSAPLPLQQLAFDQPNKAVLFFPFTWLPGFIVPVVLLSHLIAIRRLLVKSDA